MAGLSLRRFEGSAVIVGPPVVGPNERVFVGAVDGSVSCLDPRTGGVAWNAIVGDPVRAVAAHETTVFAATMSGEVVALDSGGVVQWRQTVGRGAQGALAVAPDGSLVVGTEDAKVVCLDADGHPKWTAVVGLPARGHVAFDAQGNVLLPGLDLHLWSLHASDGGVRWRRPLANAAVGAPAVGADGMVAVATLGGQVHGMTALDGTPEWMRVLGAPVVGGVARLGSGWAVATVMGQVLALEEDGQTRWQRTVQGAVAAPLAVGPAPVEGQPEWIFVVTARGELAVFDASGMCQARWDVWAGRAPPPTRALSGVARAEHGVVVASESGAVVYAPWNAPDLEPTGWAVRPTTPSVLSLPEPRPVEGAPPLPFRASHPVLDRPALVSALDTLAGFTLDVGMLEHNDEHGVAWGILTHHDGIERIAFSARRSGLGWELQADDATIPWMGLRVRMSSVSINAGTHRAAWSLRASVVPTMPSWIPWRDHPSAALERSGKPFLAARAFWERLVAAPPSIQEIVQVGRGAVRALSTLPKLSDPEVWGAWGLLDEARQFWGEGQLEIGPMPPAPEPPIVVDHVRADAARRMVTAALGGGQEALSAVPLSLVLVDVRNEPRPIPLDYSRRTRLRLADDGTPTHVELEIPLDTDLTRPVEAWVVAGWRVLWRGPMTQRTG